jgi:pimeloyl-ACP methyl ester carboxylesterase
VRQYVAQIRADGTDVDPRVWLRELDIPGLWVNGGKDRVIPVELSINELDALIAEGRPYYEHRLYPEGGHVEMGPSAEDVYRFTREWMRDRALEVAAL